MSTATVKNPTQIPRQFPADIPEVTDTTQNFPIRASRRQREEGTTSTTAAQRAPGRAVQPAKQKSLLTKVKKNQHNITEPMVILLLTESA